MNQRDPGFRGWGHRDGQNRDPEWETKLKGALQDEKESQEKVRNQRIRNKKVKDQGVGNERSPWGGKGRQEIWEHPHGTLGKKPRQ